MGKRETPPKPKKPKSYPDACVFCGRKATLTKEHMHAEWIQDYVLPINQGTNHPVSRPGVDGAQVWETGKLHRDGDPLTQTLRVVCGQDRTKQGVSSKEAEFCNNGWMSQIQQAAKETLIPMLTKGSWNITDIEANRTALAAWVTMFVMVFEFADIATVVILPEERRFLMQHRAPPPGWVICIGDYVGPQEDAENLHRARGYLDKRTNLVSPIQLTTSVVGRLVVHAVSGFPPSEFDPLWYGDYIGLPLLWPDLGQKIRQPEFSLYKGGVENLSMKLFKELGDDSNPFDDPNVLKLLRGPKWERRRGKT